MTRGRPGRPAARARVRRAALGAGPVRWARRAVVVLGVAALGAATAGCAQSDGAALARQSCAHVDRSLTLYRASLDTKDTQTASAERAAAEGQLYQALQPAAVAAGDDGQYQALMATLAESAHLPESLLVDALTQQCASVESGDEIPVPSGPSSAPADEPTSTPAHAPPSTQGRAPTA